KLMEGLCMPIDEEMLSIPISNSVYAILKRRENYLCSLLQKKFGCITVLKSIRNPTKVYRKTLKEGIEVSVWIDDLPRHEADALVNAANDYLHHFGGLAFALLKAGGPEIEEQCKQFIEKNGPLIAGQIAITSGGRLPCKQVIHAVGPRWSEDQQEECCLRLETAIINILKYVNAPENNIKSVAIPALSSGTFNFPQDLCAQVIVRTIKNFIQLAPLFGYLQEIHLVSIDETTVEVMRRACEELLGSDEDTPLRGTTEQLYCSFLLQIEKICNPLLESAFQRFKRKIEGKNTGMPVCHRLYHHVPAQYCNQKYGAGIYFNKNPRNLIGDTREKCEMDHLICVFEAEVVTGSYTRGNRSYVAPPLINASSMKLYDSVVDDIHNPEIFVIFNREQALPLYLLTCSLLWNTAPETSLGPSAQNL
uniref:Poly(ADP-ribose) polymerase family member 9 n=1 Tax=Varanus komodoensis TaxID=61221 RepID=A0A8D2IYK3_VARKO